MKLIHFPFAVFNRLRVEVNLTKTFKRSKLINCIAKNQYENYLIRGAYSAVNDESDLSWIEHRRPIRVLDWELKDTDFSYPRGTLKICLDDNAEATKTIKLWHERIEQSLKKRKVPLTV